MAHPISFSLAPWLFQAPDGIFPCFLTPNSLEGLHTSARLHKSAFSSKGSLTGIGVTPGSFGVWPHEKLAQMALVTWVVYGKCLSRFCRTVISVASLSSSRRRRGRAFPACEHQTFMEHLPYGGQDKKG